jgi:hypothetical protein
LITTFLSSIIFVLFFFFTYKEFGYLSIGISFTIMTLFWLLQNSILFYNKIKNYQ